MVMVDVTMYVPASKKIILEPANYTTLVRAHRDENLPHLTKDRLDRIRVVSFSVSHRSFIPHTDELANMVVCVLRMGSPEYLASFVEQFGGLNRRWYIVLGENTGGISSREDVSLNP